MRIALVHYHLRRGGVSSVVLNQARSLTAAGQSIVIVAGEAPAENCGFPFALAGDLAYDRPGRIFTPSEIERGAERLADSILRVTEERWPAANGLPAGADIIHVHNPLLKKNSLLIRALRILSGRGVRLFLQNHDFAEDFRPGVYAPDTEYPENCHYGVINSRDFDYLRRAGLTDSGLHLIPNEVFPLRSSAGFKRTRYLYPVRAIRRKNIGEALLLSLFIPQGKTVGITLPPSKKDSAQYQKWLTLAAELNLPVEFDLGLRHNLPDLLGSTLCAITTSVKEGFGFSFLESWTAGVGLFGRRIDYVCADFEKAGVRLDSLYSSLDIPSEYISGDTAVKMKIALKRIYAAFGLNPPDDLPGSPPDDTVGGAAADFGRLDEQAQEKIIRLARDDKQFRQRLRGVSSVPDTLADWQDDMALIGENNAAIAANYGNVRVTEKLLEIYRAVLEKPVTQRISKRTLLDLYLDPRRLSLTALSDG